MTNLVTDLAGAGHPHIHTVPLPRLQGMSSLTVQTGHLTIEAIPNNVERVLDATLIPSSPPHGVLFDLGEESRWTGFILGAPLSMSATQYLLIRAAALAGDTWIYGPPLFSDRGSADPALPGGMTIDGTRVTFPALVGRAWLIEILGAPVSVTHVIVEQLPHDLTVSAHEDSETLILWTHGGVLTPGQGRQDVDFRSMAERLLAKSPAPAALALAITSATPARIAITQPRVEARYEARPEEEPLRVAVRGQWERLPFAPHPNLRPVSATLRMTARHLGRDLNAAPPAQTPPGGGLRIDRNRAAAALAAFVPLPGSPVGTLLALASVRLSILAFEAAELAVELRANAMGAPGELLVPQVVCSIAADARGWIEIEWPQPPAIATGPAALWIVLRATSGTVLWCADPTADAARAMVSSDGGAHWAPLDVVLASPLAPRVQLFHAVIIPTTVPIALRVTGTNEQSWRLTRTASESLEFTARVSLPPRMLERLALQPELALRSTSALDVSIDEIVLSYVSPPQRTVTQLALQPKPFVRPALI